MEPPLQALQLCLYSLAPKRRSNAIHADKQYRNPKHTPEMMSTSTKIHITLPSTLAPRSRFSISCPSCHYLWPSRNWLERCDLGEVSYLPHRGHDRSQFYHIQTLVFHRSCGMSETTREEAMVYTYGSPRYGLSGGLRMSFNSCRRCRPCLNTPFRFSWSACRIPGCSETTYA